MSKNIFLGDFKINNTSKPYIIAEIGVNHENSIDKAYRLIELAKEGGANAVKFQSYKASTLASKNSPAYWDISKEPTKNQYSLFKKYDSFNQEDYQKLFNFCQEIGIDFSSTPFDDESVDFLNDMVKYFKIASADITCLPLLRKIAQKEKPVIVSTGCSNIDEINFAIKELSGNGATDIIILHCILNYPTENKNANLAMITDLIKSYPNHIIGYSDHTLPDKEMTSLISSYLLGAKVIEKHFTDDKSQLGNDHYHAMDVEDLKNFNLRLSNIEELKGSIHKKEPIHSEEKSRLNARRSIVLKKKLLKGQTIDENSITYKRPGIGISPVDWDKILGKKLLIDKEEDSILFWDDLL